MFLGGWGIAGCAIISGSAIQELRANKMEKWGTKWYKNRLKVEKEMGSNWDRIDDLVV